MNEETMNLVIRRITAAFSDITETVIEKVEEKCASKTAKTPEEKHAVQVLKYKHYLAAERRWGLAVKSRKWHKDELAGSTLEEAADPFETANEGC